jgi:hypothetical protein
MIWLSNCSISLEGDSSPYRAIKPFTQNDGFTWDNVRDKLDLRLRHFHITQNPFHAKGKIKAQMPQKNCRFSEVITKKHWGH